jgi:trypsin
MERHFAPPVPRARTVRGAIVLAAACVLPASPASGVVGGQLVPEASVPWFADIGGCGGSLIAPDRILTAGTCVRGVELSQLETIQVGGTVRRGVRFAMHPDWRRRNGVGLLEDVALIQLDTPVAGVAPASLGGPLPERLRILGRGVFTVPDRYTEGEDDGQLRSAELRPISDAQCTRTYRHRRGNLGERFHAKQMLCATDADELPPQSSPCDGDGGGPLYSAPAGTPVVQGIISWGGARCGANDLPAVFADVDHVRGFVTARNPVWAPVPDGPAVVFGTARPGRRLRCDVSSWTVAPTRLHVFWERGTDALPVPAGAGRTYTVRHRDAGHILYCSIRGSNAGGVVAAASTEVSQVTVPGAERRSAKMSG